MKNNFTKEELNNISRRFHVIDNSYLTEKTKLKVINKTKQTIRVNNPSFNKICREK